MSSFAVRSQGPFQGVAPSIWGAHRSGEASLAPEPGPSEERSRERGAPRGPLSPADEAQRAQLLSFWTDEGAAGQAGAGPSVPHAELAVFVIENIQQGRQPLAGLPDVPSRRLAWRLLEHIQRSRAEFDACNTLGVHRRGPDGVRELVRPAPAHVIAGLMGLMPLDPAYAPG